MLHGKFSSSEILRLRESLGDTAVWQYIVRTGELRLSSAARTMLGLGEQGDVDISMVMSALGCADRFGMDDFRESLALGLLAGKTFDVKPPHEAPRALLLRYSRFVSADRREERLDGLLIDVTMQQAALQSMSQRRRYAAQLLDRIGFFEWYSDAGGLVRPNTEWLMLTGQPLAEQTEAWQEMIVREDRRATVEAADRVKADPTATFYAQFRVKTVGGGTASFVGGGAPIVDDHGRKTGLAGRCIRCAEADPRPLALSTPTAVAVVSARELRAARAILGWSMQELAEAAQVSLSTVRRLEDGEGSIRPSNLQRVIDSLQLAGVAFLAAEAGRIGISLKRG